MATVNKLIHKCNVGTDASDVRTTAECADIGMAVVGTRSLKVIHCMQDELLFLRWMQKHCVS